MDGDKDVDPIPMYERTQPRQDVIDKRFIAVTIQHFKWPHPRSPVATVFSACPTPNAWALRPKSSISGQQDTYIMSNDHGRATTVSAGLKISSMESDKTFNRGML